VGILKPKIKRQINETFHSTSTPYLKILGEEVGVNFYQILPEGLKNYLGISKQP
jgi:hypothetical protein